MQTKRNHALGIKEDRNIKSLRHSDSVFAHVRQHRGTFSFAFHLCMYRTPYLQYLAYRKNKIDSQEFTERQSREERQEVDFRTNLRH